MVKRLSVRNYKSVKNLNIEVKRINIFIGEHNSGKSNILEALSWFSVNALSKSVFNQLFRFRNISNLFYDFDATQNIEVETDALSMKIRYARNNYGALLNHFEGIIYDDLLGIDDIHWHNNKNVCNFTLSQTENDVSHIEGTITTPFRTYQFKRLSKFETNFLPYLAPPFGENIPNILQSNKEWKSLVSEFFRSKGFRLVSKPTENEIEMAKDVNDELYSFPYPTISETMQRFVFLLLALESNKDAVLILDEPESNMFPFFVKDFAERMTNDSGNQYFIATHSPYLLGSLLEKAPLQDIAVFITEMKDYQTQVRPCTDEQISELISLGSGSFFNLDNI